MAIFKEQRLINFKCSTKFILSYSWQCIAWWIITKHCMCRWRVEEWKKKLKIKQFCIAFKCRKLFFNNPLHKPLYVYTRTNAIESEKRKFPLTFLRMMITMMKKSLQFFLCESHQKMEKNRQKSISKKWDQ